MKIPENILEVKIADEYFGFDGDAIEQILRIPNITPVPLSTSSLRGVVSLSGKIVTVIDTAVVLGYDPIDISNDKCRILTLNIDGSDYALLVDSAEDMGGVESENYESMDKNDSMIAGFYKQRSRICQVVDISSVCESVSLQSFTPVEIEDISYDEELIEKSSKNDYLERFLFFRLGEESYALALDLTREIIFTPDSFTPISETEKEVLGMITLRNELITSLNLNEIFGYPTPSRNDKQRLLIVSYDSKSTALLVDEVEDVKDISSNDLEQFPSDQLDSKIESLYKSNNRVTSVINGMYIKNLILHHYIQEEKKSDETIKLKEGEEMAEVVVFGVGDEEYALDIENVQEIIKYCEVTPIPEAPQFVEGMINLRGSVIPIISLPDRLGFCKNITQDSKILVSIIDGEKVGLFVDEVKEILSVEDRFISKSKAEDSLFSEILNLQEGQRVILKLRNSSIIDAKTLERIRIEEEALV